MKSLLTFLAIKARSRHGNLCCITLYSLIDGPLWEESTDGWWGSPPKGPVKRNVKVFCVVSPNRTARLGVTEPILAIPLYHVCSQKKSTPWLSVKNHIHIWLVSPQLSCQIWTWLNLNKKVTLHKVIHYATAYWTMMPPCLNTSSFLSDTCCFPGFYVISRV